MTDDKTRRALLKTTGIIGATALSGCAGDGGENTGSPTSTENNGGNTESATSTESSNSGKYGGDLIYSRGAGVGDLDPHYGTGTSNAGQTFLTNICETLIKVGPQLQPQPRLPEDISLSDDGRTYTFSFPEGVMFHPPVDREFVADDAVASLKRIRDGEKFNYHNNFQVMSRIEATDDYTMKIHLDEAYTPLLNNFVFTPSSIIPRDYFDEMQTHPVGTGPFMYDDREQGNWTQMKRFEDYRIDKFPYVDTIRSSPVSEGSVRVTELLSGDTDVAFSVPGKDSEKVANSDNAGLVKSSGTSLIKFVFNTEQEPFDNKKVRQAIRYTVDKQQLIEFALQGQGRKAISHLSFKHAYSIDESDLDTLFKQDFDKAQSLLEEAGYGDGFEFTLKVNSSVPQTVNLGAPLQRWLQEIGVDVNIEKRTQNHMISKVLGQTEYEMAGITWFGQINPWIALEKIYQTGADYNMMNYSNSEVDDLLKEGNQLQNGEERKEVYKEVQKIVYDDVADIIPAWRTQLYGRVNAVKGQLVWPTGGPRFWHNSLDR